MSNEVKKPRSVVDLNKEYSRFCAQLGELMYRKYTIEKDIEMLSDTLKDLNNEGAAAIRAEAEAKEKAQKESVTTTVESTDQAPASDASKEV
jgi:hypothetical protein